MGVVKYWPCDKIIRDTTKDRAGVQDSWSTSLQQARSSDITLSTLNSPLSGSCLRVYCHKDFLYNGVNRSENRSYYDNSYEGGIGFRIFLPVDYSDDPEPEILHQVHESGGSPAISLQSRSGTLFFNTNRGTFANAVNTEHPIGNVVRGEWINIVYKYKLAQSGQGYLKIWRNGNLLIDHVGTIGYANSEEPPYKKFGIYKWRWVVPGNSSTVVDRTVYYDEIRYASGDVAYADIEPTPVIIPNKYDLVLVSVGNGTVVDDINEGPYENGTVGTATATPNPGNIFLRWEDSTGEKWDQKTITYTINGTTELTAFFEAKKPDPTPTSKIILHRITHILQKYICPSNVENGDNIGKVEHLRSHSDFHNRRFGTNVIDSDYTFEIISGNSDNAFSINNANGELYIDSASKFTSSRTLTVRVYLYSWYYHDTSCEITYIPASNCVYIDPDTDAENRNGTRNAPWRKLRTSLTESQAGKTYLFRRDRTIVNDWTAIVNPIGAEYINIGAWGKGQRPLVSGDNSITGNKNNRFVQVGGDGMQVDGSTPELEGNNLRVFDLETTLSDPENNAWYPFEIKPKGKNIEFHRIKCSHVSAWQDGFFWLAGPYESGVDPERNILLRDIECREFQYRAIKPETGGVLIENVDFYSTLPNSETPLGFATHPYCTVKYMRSKLVNADPSKFGLQIRAHDHNYHWASLTGYPNALTFYFLSDVYDINANIGFHDILIKNGIGKVAYFGRSNGTTKKVNGGLFERVDVVDGVSGIEISEDAIGTEIRYCDLRGVSGNSIRDFNGVGTKIHNVSAGTISMTPTDFEMVNTQYQNLIGTPFVNTTNSTSIVESELTGSGTDLGYDKDIRGIDVPTIPSIGAYEFGFVNVPPEITITNPTNLLEYKVPATIPLRVDATDVNEDITHVDYFVNGFNLATSSVAPYSVDLNNINPGSYAIMARVYDSEGFTDSETVNITVKPSNEPTTFITLRGRFKINSTSTGFPYTLPIVLS